MANAIFVTEIVDPHINAADRKVAGAIGLTVEEGLYSGSDSKVIGLNARLHSLSWESMGSGTIPSRVVFILGLNLVWLAKGNGRNFNRAISPDLRCAKVYNFYRYIFINNPICRLVSEN